jgi:hypothetical protein
MTKKQVETMFKEEVLPFINRSDKPALREAWNNYTDLLCKDGQITIRQYETWTQPVFIKGRK